MSVTLDRLTWAVVIVGGVLATLSTDGTGWRIAGVVLTVLAIAGLVLSLIRPESFVSTTMATTLLLMIMLTSLGGERRDELWWFLFSCTGVLVLMNLIGLFVIHRRQVQAPV